MLHKTPLTLPEKLGPDDVIVFTPSIAIAVVEIVLLTILTPIAVALTLIGFGVPTLFLWGAALDAPGPYFETAPFLLVGLLITVIWGMAIRNIGDMYAVLKRGYSLKIDRTGVTVPQRPHHVPWDNLIAFRVRSGWTVGPADFIELACLESIGDRARLIEVDRLVQLPFDFTYSNSVFTLGLRAWAPDHPLAADD